MKNKCYVFWKRIFAYLIDMIILGIPSILICFLFFEPISSLGNWARIIGFSIFVLYFGLSNSKLCKGQTLGKKIFKIKVIGYNGEYLSVQKSLLRAAILSPVVILNGISISVVSPLLYIVGSIWGILFLSNILLLIFNTPARQIIHDLILKSYVVNYNVGEMETGNEKTIKAIIIFIISIIIICGTNIWASKYFNVNDYVNLNNSLDDKFKDCINSIQYEKSYVYNPERKESKQSLGVIYTFNAKNLSTNELKMYADGNDKKAFNLFNQLIKNDKNIKNADYINIIFVKDANLGIGHAHFFIRYSSSIENLLNKIKEYNIE